MWPSRHCYPSPPLSLGARGKSAHCRILRFPHNFEKTQLTNNGGEHGKRNDRGRGDSSARSGVLVHRGWSGSCRAESLASGWYGGEGTVGDPGESLRLYYAAKSHYREARGRVEQLCLYGFALAELLHPGFMRAVTEASEAVLQAERAAIQAAVESEGL